MSRVARSHQIQFMKKIQELANAPDIVTIGVVHDLNAARFADHIVVLNEARVVAQGTVTEVLTAEGIQEVFGVKATFMSSEDSGIHIIGQLRRRTSVLSFIYG